MHGTTNASDPEPEHPTSARPDRSRSESPPDPNGGVDVRILALVVALALSGGVVAIAYVNPPLGAAIGVGVVVLGAVLALFGWGPARRRFPRLYRSVGNAPPSRTSSCERQQCSAFPTLTSPVEHECPAKGGSTRPCYRLPPPHITKHLADEVLGCFKCSWPMML